MQRLNEIVLIDLRFELSQAQLLHHDLILFFKLNLRHIKVHYPKVSLNEVIYEPDLVMVMLNYVLG